RPTSRTRRASPAISRADSILQSASMVRWVSVAVMATDDTIVARAAQAKIPHALLRAAADTASRGFAQLTIQGVPKRSVHMPKRCAQKVSWTGMVTLPPSARVLKIRSASAGCSTAAITLKPSGVVVLCRRVAAEEELASEIDARVDDLVARVVRGPLRARRFAVGHREHDLAAEVRA